MDGYWVGVVDPDDDDLEDIYNQLRREIFRGQMAVTSKPPFQSVAAYFHEIGRTP